MVIGGFHGDYNRWSAGSAAGSPPLREDSRRLVCAIGSEASVVGSVARGCHGQQESPLAELLGAAAGENHVACVATNVVSQRGFSVT